MEDLLIALAERARASNGTMAASNGTMAASNEEADPAEDSNAPDNDIDATAQQIGDLPSAAELEEGAGYLCSLC